MRPLTKSARGESGSVLIVVFFVVTLLGTMGIALLFLTQNEVSTSRADVRLKQSFFVAEAGLEDARRSLFLTNGSGTFDDDLTAAAGINGILEFDPRSFGLVRDADGRVTGITGAGDDVPLAPVTLFGEDKDVQGRYLVFLTNDPLESPDELDDSNDRVMISAIGVAANRSVEVVQAIVEKLPLMPSPPPAAIMMLGPQPNYVGTDNSASSFEGEDCGGTGEPGMYVPTVGLVGAAAETSAETGWSDKPVYQSGPYTGKDTMVDLTDPTSSPLVTAPLDPGWQDCQTMHDMVEKLRAQADVICADGSETGSDCIIPPTGPDTIVFGDGDLDIGAGETASAGTIVVTGRLLRPGNHSWSGLIFVIGEGSYETSGGGTGVSSGSLIVADIAGPDGIYGNADDCTGGPAGDGFGIADYLANGGGSSTIQYCSLDIGASAPFEPFYPIVEFLQQ